MTLTDLLANQETKTVDLSCLKAVWIECVKVPFALIRKAENLLKKHGLMEGKFYPLITSLSGVIFSMPPFVVKNQCDSVTLESSLLRNNIISFTNERVGELWKSSTIAESGPVLPSRIKSNNI